MIRIKKFLETILQDAIYRHLLDPWNVHWPTQVTHCDLEDPAMEHHLVAHVKIFHGVEYIIPGSGQRNAMPANQCSCKSKWGGKIMLHGMLISVQSWWYSWL